MIKSLGAAAIVAAVVATGCSNTTARVISTKPAANQHVTTNPTSAASAGGGIVESSTTVDGTTYRLVYRHSGCPGPCNPILQSAPAGTTNWTTLRRVTSGFGAAVTASRSLVVVTAFGHPAGGASDAHTSYLISTDAGATWRTRSDPCGGQGMQEWDTTKTAVAHETIVSLCQRRQAPPAYAVVSSHDGGQNFTARRPVTGARAREGRAWLIAALRST